MKIIFIGTSNPRATIFIENIHEITLYQTVIGLDEKFGKVS